MVKKWTKEKVISDLTKLHKKGGDLSVKSMMSTSLYRYCYVFFKNYKHALSEIGIDYNNVCKLEIWDKPKIIEAILNRYESNLPLNSSSLRLQDKKLYDAIYNHFGSLEKGIIESVIDYDEIRKDHLSFSYHGREFEKILDNILLDLKITYNKYNHDHWNPDYVLNNNVWIDAKLTVNAAFNSNTIKNYEPHCRFLTIVYLHGKEYDKMITKKTRLLSVEKLIKQLPNNLRKKYINEIEKLRKKINIPKENFYIKENKFLTNKQIKMLNEISNNNDTVTKMCKRVGIATSTYYQWKRKDTLFITKFNEIINKVS